MLVRSAFNCLYLIARGVALSAIQYIERLVMEPNDRTSAIRRLKETA